MTAMRAAIATAAAKKSDPDMQKLAKHLKDNPEGSKKKKDKKKDKAFESVTVVLELAKETPNTIRYDAAASEGDDPAVKTLYVQKSAFGKADAPQRLEIVVRAAD